MYTTTEMFTPLTNIERQPPCLGIDVKVASKKLMESSNGDLGQVVSAVLQQVIDRFPMKR